MVRGTYSKVKMILDWKVEVGPSTSSEELKKNTRIFGFITAAISMGALALTSTRRDTPACLQTQWGRCIIPAPLYNAWFQSFNKEDWKPSYQAVGSGAGVRQQARLLTLVPLMVLYLIRNRNAYGSSPMTGGAIVPAYNLPGCDAKMTQTQLADVFLGKITN